MNSKLIIDALIDDQSNLGQLLATSTQDGYVLHIYGNVDDASYDRQGTQVITSPDGASVFSGYWMDWPENHWPDNKNYYKLTRAQRAQLEANEQLKYGLKTSFDHHLKLSSGQPYRTTTKPKIELSPGAVMSWQKKKTID